MDNGAYRSGEFLPDVVGGLKGWDVRGVADINRDGKPDLVWRNLTTGENAVWLMNGLTIASSYLLTTVADLNWHLEAVADLSNDGVPDLIWRNYGTGENVVWYLDRDGRYSGNPGTFDYLQSVPAGAGWKLGGRAEDVDGVPNPVHRK